MPSVVFTPSGDDTVGVPFDIYDNNVGGQTMRSVGLRLSLSEPQVFSDDVNFMDPALYNTITVVIVDDDGELQRYRSCL